MWKWKIMASYTEAEDVKGTSLALPTIWLDGGTGAKATTEAARKAAVRSVEVYAGPRRMTREPGRYELKISTSRWLDGTTWAFAVTVGEHGHITVSPNGYHA